MSKEKKELPEVSKYYESLLSGRIYFCIAIHDNFVILKDYKLDGNPKYKWTKEMVFLSNFWKDFKEVNKE